MATTSPVLSGNRVYTLNEKRRGQIVCMAVESGKVLWACPGSKGEHATLYDAGANVLAFTIGGELLVFNRVQRTLIDVV